MAFEAYREPLYRRYYAPILSLSCVWVVTCVFFSIFIPIIISYNSGNFWMKEKIAYEQPDVSYDYIGIFHFYGEDSATGTGVPKSLFYSTSRDINNLFENNLRMAVVRSSEVDQNNDGLLDRLEVGIQLPLKTTESITGIQAMFTHNCILKEKAKYSFDSVSYISHESGYPMGNLDIDGDLMIRQSMSLSTKGGFKLPYDNDPLLAITERMSARDVSMQNIMRRASGRNLTTIFKPSYSYASIMVDPTSPDTSAPKFFNATLSLRVPSQPLLYTPTATEVLKFAWIQFVAFFFVIGFLFYRLTGFVFRHRLLYAKTEADIVHDKPHTD